MFKSAKIPLSFLVIGICWALFSNPIITLFYRHLAPHEQDSYRSLNDLIFVIIISYVLYVKIKKQQLKLTKSEEEYRQLFESNPNPLWIYNQEQRFVKVNDAAVKKYGHNRRKFLKMAIDEINSAVGDQILHDYLNESQGESRLAGIREHVKATGGTFMVSIVSYPVLFQNQNCNLVMATDITELIEKSRQEIIDLALSEVREFFPEARSANLVKSTVIKEVNATYSPRPGIDAFRPAHVTGWPGVFLAGDWTATGWPATMEGAVRSGYGAAEAVLQGKNFLVPDLRAGGLMRLFS